LDQLWGPNIFKPYIAIRDKNPDAELSQNPQSSVTYIQGVSSDLYLGHNVARDEIELSHRRWSPTDGDYDGTRWRLISADGVTYIQGVSSGLYLGHNVARDEVELSPRRWSPADGDYDGTRWRLINADGVT
jgi:hypothetical protein